MKAADLYRLMENPALLTEETLPQLKQIVDEFPYFQIARMLYLKNLAVLNDIRFGAELKKMAIYVPDRRKLFTQLELPGCYAKPDLINDLTVYRHTAGVI